MARALRDKRTFTPCPEWDLDGYTFPKIKPTEKSPDVSRENEINHNSLQSDMEFKIDDAAMAVMISLLKEPIPVIPAGKEIPPEQFLIPLLGKTRASRTVRNQLFRAKKTILKMKKPSTKSKTQDEELDSLPCTCPGCSMLQCTPGSDEWNSNVIATIEHMKRTIGLERDPEYLAKMREQQETLPEKK